jgi:hypothetical protein
MIAVIAPFAARGPGPTGTVTVTGPPGGGLPVGLSDRHLNAAACIEKHAACIAGVLGQRAVFRGASCSDWACPAGRPGVGYYPGDSNSMQGQKSVSICYRQVVASATLA